MAREAHIIGEIEDADGHRWDLRERRPTPHGFDVCLGWPHGAARGRGGAGGPKVILTQPLVDYLERHRASTRVFDLPIGRSAIKRLRREVGHHRYKDARAWWEKRVLDLETLTLEQFAQKHGCSVGAAAWARLELLGRTLRPAGWWKDPEVRRLLTSGRPASRVAKDLHLTPSSVYRLRSAVRELDAE